MCPLPGGELWYGQFTPGIGTRKALPGMLASSQFSSIDALTAWTYQITTLSRKHYKIERCLPPLSPELSSGPTPLHPSQDFLSTHPPPLQRDGLARILSSNSRSGLCASEDVSAG